MNTKYIGLTIAQYLDVVIPQTTIFENFSATQVDWNGFYLKNQREIGVSINLCADGVYFKDIPITAKIPEDYVVCGTCLELHPQFSAIDQWSVFGDFLMCLKCKRTKGIK